MIDRILRMDVLSCLALAAISDVHVHVVLVAKELEKVGIKTDSILTDVIALVFVGIAALLEEDGEARESIKALRAEVGHLRACDEGVLHVWDGAREDLILGRWLMRVQFVAILVEDVWVEASLIGERVRRIVPVTVVILASCALSNVDTVDVDHCVRNRMQWLLYLTHDFDAELCVLWHFFAVDLERLGGVRVSILGQWQRYIVAFCFDSARLVVDSFLAVGVFLPAGVQDHHGVRPRRNYRRVDFRTSLLLI